MEAAAEHERFVPIQADERPTGKFGRNLAARVPDHPRIACVDHALEPVDCPGPSPPATLALRTATPAARGRMAMAGNRAMSPQQANWKRPRRGTGPGRRRQAITTPLSLKR